MYVTSITHIRSCPTAKHSRLSLRGRRRRCCGRACTPPLWRGPYERRTDRLDTRAASPTASLRRSSSRASRCRCTPHCSARASPRSDLWRTGEAERENEGGGVSKGGGGERGTRRKSTRRRIGTTHQQGREHARQRSTRTLRRSAQSLNAKMRCATPSPRSAQCETAGVFVSTTLPVRAAARWSPQDSTR